MKVSDADIRPPLPAPASEAAGPPRSPQLAIARPRAAEESATEEFPAASHATMPTLSCVIPCHNEAENLGKLLPRLREQLGTCSRAWEIILVDDGSTDGTAALLAAWSLIPGFRMLELSRNFGKEAALTAGLQASKGEVVVMMDADMQHSPDMIGTFVEHWRNGAEVVYTVREHRRDESAFKRLGTRLFYSMVNAAARFKVPEGAGDFRLMDRRVVDALLALPERNRFMKGLYAWVGFKAVAVPYVPEPRAHGTSSFGALRLIGLSLDGLTTFTTWPLRAVSMAGFALAALAFLYGAYLTLCYLIYGHDVSGWTTIVVSLMLFAGIQMISLGIVGEYIGRVFEEVKGRPLFVVKRRMGHGLEERRR